MEVWGCLRDKIIRLWILAFHILTIRIGHEITECDGFRLRYAALIVSSEFLQGCFCSQCFFWLIQGGVTGTQFAQTSVERIIRYACLLEDQSCLLVVLNRQLEVIALKSEVPFGQAGFGFN